MIHTNLLGMGNYRCPRGVPYPDFRLWEGPRCPIGHVIPHEMQRSTRFVLCGPANRPELFAALCSPTAFIRERALLLLPSSADCGLLSQTQAERWVRRGLADPVATVRGTAEHVARRLAERPVPSRPVSLHDLTREAVGMPLCVP